MPRIVPLPGVTPDATRPGSWRVTRTLNGRRVHRRAPSLEQANAIAAELDRRAAAHLSVAPDRLTVEDWLRAWLATKVDLADTSRRTYGEQIDRRLAPAIGHIKLVKLTPAHVRQVVAEIWQTGASASIVELSWVVLNAALKQAVADGILLRNPAAGVKRPSAGTQARPYDRESAELSPEQARAFLAAARLERHFPLFLLAIATGARRGELLGLRWQDVDTGTATIRIAAKLTRMASGFTVEPRRKSGGRPVKLIVPGFVAEILDAHRQRQETERDRAGDDWTDHGLVFPTARGTPTLPNNIINVFDRVVGGANVELARLELPLIPVAARRKQDEPRTGAPHFRFHDLRHSAATFWLALGADLLEVRDILGHSDIQTTSRYAHVTKRAAAGRADQMDRFLREISG